MTSKTAPPINSSARVTSQARPPETQSLEILKEAAASCTACPLYRDATQTVFGEGPQTARVVFIGEQPGDQEDRTGRPFIGPAGKLLDRALEEAGITREECYITNAVKHFKWESRGKHRLHKKPERGEIRACSPWWKVELSIIKPTFLVCLGSSAASIVFHRQVKVLSERGSIAHTPFCDQTLITIHPSSILRAPSPEAKEKDYALFVQDLMLLSRK